MATFDREEAVSRYVAGESAQSIGNDMGITYPAVRRAVRAAGYPVRGRSEAAKIRRLSEEGRRKRSEAIRSVLGGKQRSYETLCKIAQAHERNQDYGSPAESLMGHWLIVRGLGITPQKAIGKYNVDLAVANVAVELYGSHLHARGPQASRSDERARFLFEEGWQQAIIWYDNRRYRLGEAAADRVVQFVHDCAPLPDGERRYLVIWGNGECVTAPMTIDNFASVSPYHWRPSAKATR